MEPGDWTGRSEKEFMTSPESKSCFISRYHDDIIVYACHTIVNVDYEHK